MESTWKNHTIPWQVLLIFFLLAVGIVLAGVSYYEKEKKHLAEKEFEKLAAIADLKVRKIALWRRERMGDALFLFSNPEFAARVQKYLQNPSSGPCPVRSWLKPFCDSHRYADILLLDTRKRVRLSLKKGRMNLDGRHAGFADRVLQTGQILYTDLPGESGLHRVDMALVVPVLIPQRKSSRIVGVVMLLIDPAQSLYPMVKSWPTPSPSGETLLVSRSGDEFVFLNELRHRKDSDLKLSLPVSALYPSAAPAGSRQGGIAESRDYRNIPVLAVLRRVPESPWHLVAKIDAAETYAPLKDKLGMVTLIIGLLILSSGAGMGFFWCHRQALFYRSEYQEKLAREALTKHYEYLTRYANDAIMLLKLDGRIVEINERVGEKYGYNREELLAMNIRDLRHPESRSALEGLTAKPELKKGLIYETVHRRKDGATFPVEVSARQVAVEGEIYFQEIIRDLTARKLMEQELRVMQVSLEDVHRLAQIGVWDWTLASDRVIWSGGYKDIYGFDPRLLAPPYGEQAQMFTPQSWLRLQNSVERALETGDSFQLEIEFVRPEGVRRWAMVFGGPKYDSLGQIIGLHGAVQDITGRKEAEKRLQSNESRLKEAQHLAHLGHWELGSVAGTPVWSEEIFSIFGLDPAKGEPSFSAHEPLIHPEDWPLLQRAVVELIGEGTPFDIEFRILRPDKSRRWVSARGYAVRNIEGRVSRMFGTAQDITERKLAQQALEDSRKQLRALARRLQSIREEERKEIAREIHDELGGALTGLKIDLSQLSKSLSLIHDQDKRKWSQEKAREMMELMDKIMYSARRIMSDLRPSILDDFGLSAALEWQIQNFRQRTGIRAEYIATETDLALDEECSIALFRIVQESLNNVFRHARATRVTVTFGKEADYLQLTIADNGIGMGSKGFAGGNTFGIMGMQERALLLGGTLEVTASPVQGTTVSVRIPFREQEKFRGERS